MEKRGVLIDGPKLKELRFQKGITIEDLVEASHVSDNTITEVESGARLQVRERTLFALAKALGVQPGDLMKAGVPGAKEVI